MHRFAKAACQCRPRSWSSEELESHKAADRVTFAMGDERRSISTIGTEVSGLHPDAALQDMSNHKHASPCCALRWKVAALGLVIRRRAFSGLRGQPLSRRYWACLALAQLKHSALADLCKNKGKNGLQFLIPSRAPGFMHISPKWTSPISDSSSLMKSLLPRLTPPEEMTTSACDSVCIFCRHKCEPLT